jgi:hypothetical protein
MDDHLEDSEIDGIVVAVEAAMSAVSRLQDVALQVKERNLGDYAAGEEFHDAARLIGDGAMAAFRMLGTVTLERLATIRDERESVG